MFGRGYGQDTITDYDDIARNSDTILLKPDVTPDNVTLWRDASNLYLGINGTNDRITVPIWYDDLAYRVEQIEFSNGTVWNAATLAAAKFVGTDAADYLFGSAGDDVMEGFGGADFLTGEAGNDTLDGGAGNDTLVGGVGNDTYVFGRGYGQDTISNYDTTAGNSDTILLKPDVASGDVTLWRDSSNIYVSINGTNDSISVDNWFADPAYRVEKVQFADGTVWNSSTMLAAMFRGTDAADYIAGSAGNDVIVGLGGDDALYGDIGNDTLDGGTGNDTLVGGTGNDTYLFGRGSGQDTISEYDPTAGNIDTIRLAVGISASDVTLSRDAYNLYLDINGTTDRITVQNWFADLAYRVEQVQFADGTIWDAAKLQQSAVFLGTAGADNIYGTAQDETIDGLGGGDYLAGSTGNDTYVFGRGYGEDTISDYDTTAGNSDTIFLKPDVAPGDVTLWRDSSNLYLGINGTSDTITVQSWFDDPAYRVEKVQFADGTVWNASIMQAAIFRGTDAADSITGTAGNDVIEGLGGDDALYGDIGNNFLNGGAGTDSLEGSSGNELFIGGSGNDTITTNTGADIIAFNRGDGVDTVNASTSTGADSTLSLGGGIRQADLSFRKDTSNLVLDTGNGESIVFMDWYAASTNHSLLTLQMIEEAAPDFNPTGGDVLRDNKIEAFNFQGLADRFDQAVAANSGLTSWALTQALSDFHLAGSDTAALGGDLAYQYGNNGNLSNVGLTAAQSILSDPAFGSSAQTLKPLAGLQEGALRLG